MERLSRIVNFELFRPDLARAVPRSDGSKGGRPPFDLVFMFKVLILQASHSLSDERTEFLIKDRLSFMRFLGLGLSDPVPDANTIWTFCEALMRAEIAGMPAIVVLFSAYEAALRQAGFLAMGGQIVDATVVAAPKQRNTEAEKADLKAGRVPDAWVAKPAKLAQKDRDARWTIKWSKAKPAEDGAKRIDLAVPSFGYKNHIGIDRRHGLIRTWTATDAARHDGAKLPRLVSKANTAGGRLGRHRLSLEGQRTVPRSPWLPLPHALQEAAGQANGEEYRPRQRREVEGPRGRRTCLRPAERVDGARGAHDRLGASPDEDRLGQPHVQHEPGDLAHRLPDEDSLRIGIAEPSPTRAGDEGYIRSANRSDAHNPLPEAAVKSVSGGVQIAPLTPSHPIIRRRSPTSKRSKSSTGPIARGIEMRTNALTDEP